MIAIVDLGLGNMRSVERALAAAATEAGTAAPTLTRDPDAIARADRVIVPGQGAFRDGTAALARDGGALGGAIREALGRGTPYLGICLGLQLLFDGSDEAPGAVGLSIFAGRVTRIPPGLRDATGRALKVPHMGWNQPLLLETPAGAIARPWMEADGVGAWFYFVHSYQALPDDPSVVAATASYGCLEITSAIARDSVFATQFHPEKSQRAGLALLAAFLAG